MVTTRTKRESMRATERQRGSVDKLPAWPGNAVTSGFVPPPYPYERLDGLLAKAGPSRRCRRLSIGTPVDPPPPTPSWPPCRRSGSERGYPSSPGSARAAPGDRRLDRPPVRRRRRRAARSPLASARRSSSAPCRSGCGCAAPTATPCCTPPSPIRPTRWGRSSPAAVRSPCRSRPTDGSTSTSIAESDAARALALWVNSPGNPTGACDDLGAVAAWGRARDVPVFSDECYVEFTWHGPSQSILQHGTDGVVAVHSLSKRSNLAGVRVGFYAGDAELVDYLQQVRKHVGMMVPGPAQAAAVVALDDDDHVVEQRERYVRRLGRMGEILGHWLDIDVPLPAGGFYLWFDVGDGWAFAERLARRGRRGRQPGRVLRRGERAASSASPSCSPTIASSSSPSASGLAEIGSATADGARRRPCRTAARRRRRRPSAPSCGFAGSERDRRSVAAVALDGRLAARDPGDDDVVWTRRRHPARRRRSRRRGSRPRSSTRRARAA